MEVFGWSIIIIASLPIPIYMVYHLYHAKGSPLEVFVREILCSALNIMLLCSLSISGHTSFTFFEDIFHVYAVLTAKILVKITRPYEHVCILLF